MAPRATPPIGSVNDQPVDVPPPFDVVYEQVRQRHDREEWRAAMILLALISGITFALYIADKV